MILFYIVKDFGPLSPSQLNFNVGELSACASIGTLNDLLYEEDETFTVSVTSSNPSVNIGVSSTIVDIRDNDGRLFILTQHL